LVLHQLHVFVLEDGLALVENLLEESLRVPHHRYVLVIALASTKLALETGADVLPRKLVLGQRNTPVQLLQIHGVAKLKVRSCVSTRLLGALVSPLLMFAHCGLIILSESFLLDRFNLLLRLLQLR